MAVELMLLHQKSNLLLIDQLMNTIEDDLLSHLEQRSILEDMPEDTLLAKAFKARTKKK